MTDHNVHEALKITTRSYLIKDGKVRTQGTPTQIVRDPIAIAEYLGVGFTDNSYRSPSEQVREMTPTPAAPAAKLEPAPAAKPMPAPKPAPKTLEFPGTQKLSPAQLILEQEKINKLVGQLKSDNAKAAADELVKKGLASVPALLSALERRDAELRQLAVDVLAAILKHPVPFDAFAPKRRKKQLAALRELFERKAGLTLRFTHHRRGRHLPWVPPSPAMQSARS